MSIDSTAPNPIVHDDGLPYSPISAPGKTDRYGLGGVPWLWTCALRGLRPQTPITLHIGDVAVEVTLASHTTDEQQIADALTDLSRTVAEHIGQGLPAGTVVSPRLPEQVAKAEWRTSHGTVTLIHPKARRNGYRGRFLSVGCAAAVVPLWAHKAGATAVGLGVAAVASAGVAAGVTVLAVPSDPLLHPHRPSVTAPAALHQYGHVQAHAPASTPPQTAAPQAPAAPAATQPPDAGPAGSPSGDSPSGTTPGAASSPGPATATPATAGNTPGSGKTKAAKSPKLGKTTKPAKVSKSPKPGKPPRPGKKTKSPAPDPSPAGTGQ